MLKIPLARVLIVVQTLPHQGGGKYNLYIVLLLQGAFFALQSTTIRAFEIFLP
jgi:hypothetical protein